MTAGFTAALAAYLSRQRWFAGKGGGGEITNVVPMPWLTGEADPPRVRIELVTVSGPNGSLVYQVPLSYHPREQPRLDHAYVGVLEDASLGRLLAYDALHDQEAVAAIVSGFVAAEPSGGLVHHTVGPVDLPPGVPSLMLSGEQSNTSLVLADDLLLKVFRTLEPGRNPDIEVHAALAQTGSDAVAPLRGWIEGVTPSGRYDLAMLQDFLRSGSDGWQYARASVRDLLVEGDLHADEVGGDFAGEAERLGATVARLHADLAAALPTARWGPDQVAGLAARLRGRLAAAARELPELEEQVTALGRAYDDLPGLAEVAVQRVHGDLHLGQSLRTVNGWRIIDFEGEPTKPLAERTALDSPLRDVAGMLRSFDYVAHSVVLPEAQDHQQAHRAQEWALRNREAFCTGYTAVKGFDVLGDLVLLRAYEVDKAVYEAVYEKRNRPSWLPIPLAALGRLAQQAVS